MPNIPDKIYKLSILIGLFLTGYSYIKSNENYKVYDLKYQKFKELSDSLKILNEELYFEQENFKKACSEIQIKHDLDSLYNLRNENIIFNKLLSSENLLNSDIMLLEDKWFKIRNLMHKENILEIRINNSEIDHIEGKKDYYQSLKELEMMQFIGSFLIGLGIAMWFIEDNIKPKEEIKQFEKVYNSCQSCGQKFNSLRLYGKNKDGSFNFGLCIQCYDLGSFIEKDLTKETAIKRFCSRNNIKKGMKKYLIRRKFNKLERWI